MKKRMSMILACLFLFVGMALAQTAITGTVISQEDGEPIIGASVMVDGGSKVGTVTDTDGHFTLSVPAGKKLVIIVGDPARVRMMIDNKREDGRYTGLNARLFALDSDPFGR